MRTLRGLRYELSNALRSRSFWSYVVVCVLMCISGYVQGGMFDGAFGLLAGLVRVSPEDISMEKAIRWLMPHLLLSVYMGECGERDLRMQRLSLPRCASFRSYWRFQALKLLLISLMYYALIVLGAALVSAALGNRLPKVSEAALAWHGLYSGMLPGAWAMMLEVSLRAALAMALVGLAQLALTWLTGDQRWGMAAFAALMLAPLFVADARVLRALPCDMAMYLRSGAVSDGLNLMWMCAICVVAGLAIIEALCVAARLRTVLVN